ncbi:MAG TPA: hypothetical protein VF781_01940 [Solirubrobacteraceae bacterium]
MLGVYEPLIVLAPGIRRATSLAAEPELFEAPGDCYHEACAPAGAFAAPAASEARHT